METAVQTVMFYLLLEGGPRVIDSSAKRVVVALWCSKRMFRPAEAPSYK